MKHENNGDCPRCRSILFRFPGLHGDLLCWFAQLQVEHPSAHVSCAGRGEDEQESLFLRKASKAHWKQSAHNWNAALDIFEISGNAQDIYERAWFDKVLAPSLKPWMTWYGAPGSQFHELPHVQVKDWKLLAESGKLKLVE